MRSVILSLAALAALGLAPVARAQETAAPADPIAQDWEDIAPLALTGRVVDDAQLIEPQREAALTELLAKLEQDIGVQFVVVSTPNLDGQPIEDYALALGNGRGIGDAERDDGLLLVVAPNERKARIEVGLGLERVLPDSFCQQVIRLMLPSFRQGDYADGIMIGAVSLETRLRKVAAESAG